MRERFTTLVEELRATPEIEVLGAELGAPASGDDLARLEAWFGGTVPDDIRAFYSQVGSAQIRWMGLANPAYARRGAEIPRGSVAWVYALVDPIDEEGALVLPPLDVVLDRSWEDVMREMWIWIGGKAHEGPKVAEGGFDGAVRIFDFSSFAGWPGFFRATGLVGVGSEMGWQGKRTSFAAHIDKAVKRMKARAEGVCRGEWDYGQ
ncbi:SMI1/KNR4 family protein [Nannocystis sp. ILAH1]|uniref:SMI1/KNR4 family protein n=1 Tax=Nannocystis sp. ILAH1 TaxID=2996789 RepID=UPI00226D9B35|nr:SMI1/KNR4 family protein [Nannocystis sp. ILAH1]MCY0990722.1 SMI1/KNR4 family protein [Nannocystis sp. ILAH1]